MQRVLNRGESGPFVWKKVKGTVVIQLVESAYLATVSTSADGFLLKNIVAKNRHAGHADPLVLRRRFSGSSGTGMKPSLKSKRSKSMEAHCWQRSTLVQPFALASGKGHGFPFERACQLALEQAHFAIGLDIFRVVFHLPGRDSTGGAKNLIRSCHR